MLFDFQIEMHLLPSHYRPVYMKMIKNNFRYNHHYKLNRLAQSNHWIMLCCNK